MQIQKVQNSAKYIALVTGTMFVLVIIFSYVYPHLSINSKKDSPNDSEKISTQGSTNYQNPVVPRMRDIEIPKVKYVPELSLGRHIFVKGDSSKFSLPPFSAYLISVVGERGSSKLYLDDHVRPLLLTQKSKSYIGNPKEMTVVIKNGLLVIDLYAPIAKPAGVGKNLPKPEDYGI